jgi:hypothetical protein
MTESPRHSYSFKIILKKGETIENEENSGRLLKKLFDDFDSFDFSNDVNNPNLCNLKIYKKEMADEDKIDEIMANIQNYRPVKEIYQVMK